MKKMSLFLLVIFVFPCLFFVGCGKEPELSSYCLDVVYDDEAHTAECVCKINYVNSSSNALENIKFHLYPNAFMQGKENLVCTSSSKSRTYPNGPSFGGMQIKNVWQNSKAASYQISDDELVLSVPLEKQLFPDEKVSIEIAYFLTLPNARHRFGWHDGCTNFANFYPIACVYNNETGFATDPYVANGDPFYSDCANYVVSVSYPFGNEIAFSGDNISVAQNGNIVTTSFTSNKTRDVCFVLSNKFQKASKTVDGVSVEYFSYSDPNPQKSLDLACDAVKYYSDSFGKYPYSSLCVVETGFSQGGMEYPRLVMIADSVQQQDYQYVIAHEIAHQWWYGVVGNDEFNEAWLDESLTEFSTALFFEDHPQYNISYSSLVQQAASNYNHYLEFFSSKTGQACSSMLRSLDEFTTEYDYVSNIYTRGVIMFDTLRSDIGKKKLLSVLKAYFKQYAFKNVSSEQFVAFFCEKCGRNMEGFFDSWLNGKVKFVAL